MPRGAHDAIALGPPSVLSTWAFDLLREVCALIPNRAAIRAIDREDPLEPDGDRVPLIYLSHFPSPQRPLPAARLERQGGRSASAADGAAPANGRDDY
jgi:hypothetical protein